MIYRRNMQLKGILVFLLLACTSGKEVKQNGRDSGNPLDTIFGEKIMNRESQTIRPDNFEELIGVDKKYLELPSDLYLAEQIDTNHYILRQKKSYADARNFNLLLKLKNKEIVSFKVFNDFYITDIEKDPSSWIVFLSDFKQANTFWKSKQQISVMKMDESFREIWVYKRKNKSYPLEGSSIRKKGNNYIFEVNVITGCHICYVIAGLELSEEGSFVSVEQTGTLNSGHGLEREQLYDIFK